MRTKKLDGSDRDWHQQCGMCRAPKVLVRIEFDNSPNVRLCPSCTKQLSGDLVAFVNQELPGVEEEQDQKYAGVFGSVFKMPLQITQMPMPSMPSGPIVPQQQAASQAPASKYWQCGDCGTDGHTGKTCSDCGSASRVFDWMCRCGSTNRHTRKRCRHCSAARP